MLVFYILILFKSDRVKIPLVKLTMSIQSVHAVALIISMVLTIISVTSELLCSSLRYDVFICYLTSIFVCCAATIHLWLVISRCKVDQARRNERWYYAMSYVLAILLSAALAIIPNNAYKILKQCVAASIQNHGYLGIHWGLYYGWVLVTLLISVMCVISVLRSAHRLTNITHVNGSEYPTTTEAYISAVNARANGKRLRSLVFYTIAYPLINLVCNLPLLLQQLLSAALNREQILFGFIARLLLASEGMFFALTFLLYPTVQYSLRDITYLAVQYWIVDQEEFWRQKENGIKHLADIHVLCGDLNNNFTDSTDYDNFTSLRGRIFRYIVLKTREGRRASIMPQYVFFK